MPRLLVGLVAVAFLSGCVDSLLDPDVGESIDETVDETTNVTNDTDATSDVAEADGDAPNATGEAVLTPEVPLTPTEPWPAPAAPRPPPAATPPPPPAATPPPPPAATTPAPAPTPEPTPAPAPTPEPSAWPREGSFVSYHVTGRQSFSGSDLAWQEYLNVTWTFTNGDWRAVCEGHRHETDDEGRYSVRPIRAEITSASPPHWPPMNTRSPPAVGDDVTAWSMRGCSLESDAYPYAGLDTEPTTVNGAPRVVDTHRVKSDERDLPYEFSSEWSRSHGLVLKWNLARVMTAAPFGTTGQLTDTDAPM